jgi:predicted regulator of Ras-like GTPase activity (Roadblock/LC7/MglB family)
VNAFLKKLLARDASAAVAEALAPITQVPGVTDYVLLDADGGLLARTSNFGYDDERLRRSGERLRRSAALVRAYLGDEAAEGEPLAFRFRKGWLLLWRLGRACLVVFGREGLDLPTLRMRLNILRSQIVEDKRFRHTLGEGPDAGLGWVRETAASEQERHWIDLAAGEGAP